MQLKNSIEIYLEWKSTYANVAATRYQSYLIGFSKFIGDHRNLEEVTGDDLMHFFQDMRLQITQYNRSYKEATIAYAMIIFKNFFGFWKGRGISTVNPKEIIPIRYARTMKEIVTEEDVEDMLEVLSEDNFTHIQRKLIISMLWDTGMRLSELLSINISQLNTIERRHVYIQTRKSMRYNIVAWGTRTNDLLNKYLGIRLCMDIRSDALFVSTTGRGRKRDRLSGVAVQRMVKTVTRNAMIDRIITPHSFRHGKAHHMYNNGADAIELQMMLRHVSPTTVQHYLVQNEYQYLTIANKFLTV
ncbi:MAG: tyrosine-type recombinase/integrase [Chitinophagales bacterium]|nr:tyrosine-type recombinase/integrase [Chitinophagales bacterium]